MYKEFEIRKFAEKLRESYGDIVKVRLKDRWHVFLFHPDTAKQVLEIQIPRPYRPPIDVLAVYNKKKKHCQSLASSYVSLYQMFFTVMNKIGKRLCSFL